MEIYSFLRVLFLLQLVSALRIKRESQVLHDNGHSDVIISLPMNRNDHVKLSLHKDNGDKSPTDGIRNTNTTCPVCIGKITQGQSERIVHGENAELHAHPFQVGLVEKGSTKVWCGGVLITDQYILTAAHCAKNIHPDEHEVHAILGTNIIKSGQKDGQQRIAISKVSIHKDFHPLLLLNDIALLKLKKPALLGHKVRPVCLPTKESNYTGAIAMATGWGRLKEGGALSHTLQQVELQVVSFKVCVSIFQSGLVTKDHVCAGGNGSDTCQADSGGPLVVTGEDGEKVLLGITSWGRGCGRIGNPGVYVKVSSYLSWIQQEVALDTCGYLKDLPPPSKPVVPNSSNYTCTCGKRNSGNRIIGGTMTKQNEFPWQVALVGHYGLKPFCGASIISDQWVLTAAHCAKEMYHDDHLMLAEHNWQQAADSPYTMRMEIEKIIIHPDYNKKRMDSDLALLKMKGKIDFSLYQNAIAPICLPPEDETFEKKTATITGWGVTRNAGFQPAILRAVDVPVVNQEVCKSSYGHYLTENMLCAGYASGGKDACQGDSGGPMIIKDENGSYFQAGIVSWGQKCALPKYYGVYVKVNNFLPWIKSIIGDSDTCSSD